jgi:hypothetical protein
MIIVVVAGILFLVVGVVVYILMASGKQRPGDPRSADAKIHKHNKNPRGEIRSSGSPND